MIYQKEFQPLLECVRFIEQYCNADQDYQSLLTYCQSEVERGMVEELGELCVEVGKTFLAQYEELSYMFTFMSKEKGMSAFSAILHEDCDFHCCNPHAQIIKLKQLYQNQSILFIKKIIIAEKDGVIEAEHTTEEWFTLFDELLLEDDLKWKLWKAQYHIEESLDKLEQIVIRCMPILEQHKNLYQLGLELYEQEIAECDIDFYDQLLKDVGYEHSYHDAIMIPTLAGCRSIAFNSTNENEEVVIYGIGTARRLHMDTSISDEKLCSSLKLLSDKSKFDILRYISKEKAYGAQIATELKLSTPTISYHMQALLSAQLITVEKNNNRLYYCMNTEYLRTFFKQVEERLFLK